MHERLQLHFQNLDLVLSLERLCLLFKLQVVVLVDKAVNSFMEMSKFNTLFLVIKHAHKDCCALVGFLLMILLTIG